MSEALVKLLDLRDTMKREIEEMETKVSRRTAELIYLETKTIPDVLDDMGVSSLTLEDGRKISLQDFVSVKIEDENRPAAYAWLQNKGHGDLIKHTFTVALSGSAEQKDDAEIRAVRNALEDRGVPFSEEEKIHPSTLKAFVAEQLEKGTTFPSAVFKIKQGKIARIKESKN